AANYIVDKLEATYGLLVAGDKEREIKRVAIIGGGGSRDWPAAMAEGYDMYISGDAPHYVRRDVMNAGYNYLDVPHEIENAFLWKMKEVLLTIDPSFEVIAIKHEKPPVVIK
ncbi:MAG: Nif3-like dinuclear metal center hexameric protein, partial [Bacilli bacterium]